MDLKNKISNLFNLASKSNGSVSKGRLNVELIKAQKDLWRKELNHFEAARAMRYAVEEPRTLELIKCYSDCMMDPLLTSITNNRILRILNKEFVIADKEGVNLELTTKYCDTSFFHLFVRKAMESIFYGYSMLYLPDSDLLNAMEIPREHISPEKGIIVKDVHDSTGMPYNEYPKHFIYLQMYESIGLLEKALPMTILKRHSWASWDEFEQMFGVPIRVAKMASNDKAAQREVLGWLKRIGQSGSAVLPHTADVEIKESTQKDAFGVFLEKIKAVDTQLSILINGQTMTVNDGGSRSQSETHLKTEDQITKADLKRVLQLINHHLKTILDLPENMYFDVKTEVDIKEQIKIDDVLLKHSYRMTPEYIERVYGVELDQQLEPEEKPTGKKKI